MAASKNLPFRGAADGETVSGIVQGGSVSWQLGRQRGLAL